MLHQISSSLRMSPTKRLASLLILPGLILLYSWAFQGLKINFTVIRTSLPYMTDFLSRLLPPDWSVLDVAVKALIETVQMSLIGTTIGAVLSIPIAIASAHNLAPGRRQRLANLSQNLVRSVPSIVLGLFFVSAIGLGAAAGTLPLAFIRAAISPSSTKLRSNQSIQSRSEHCK